MSVRAIEAEVSIKSGVQAECTIGREVIVEVHEEVNLESLTATANGQYEPSEGVDGFSGVTVNVPERIPVTESLSVTENGLYEPSDGIDGYDRVSVSVPERIPVTESLTATSNGTYEPDIGVDGYDHVTVAVPERQPEIESLTVTTNGTYESTKDGYNPVTVNVPERQPVTESLSVAENGTYEASEGIDGYDRVVVDVPPTVPDIEPLTVTENGTYQASGDGYNPVTVVVPERQPITESLSVTQNGTYTPSSGVDGYDRVEVDVPPTIPEIEALTVTEDGVYTSSGDGYNPVTVNTGVASLRQEIASAETASGCSPLTDGLTALTTYANEVTGAEDATLSDAVETLVNGYGFLGRKVKTGVLKLNSKFTSKVSILYTNDRGIGFTPSYFAIWVSNRTGLSRYSVLYAFYSSAPQYKATINLSTASGGIGATASESAKETINSNMLYTSGVFIYFEGSANYALEATEYNWIAIE